MARVLIVDDKSEIRLLLKAAVEREGHRALLARDAAEADKLLAEKPELLVVDISLAGGESGLELAQRIRLDARYARIPVVVITAMADAEAQLRGKLEEPVAVLEKPFRFEQVTRAIHQVLRSS